MENLSSSNQQGELNPKAEVSANSDAKRINEIDSKLKLALKNETSIFNGILTPEEEKEVLKRAAREKEGKMNRQKYWDEINAPDKVIEYWKWDELVEDIQEAMGADFIVDDENRFVIETLAKYFCNDKSFEEISPNYSLSKGIILHGPVGVGKSKLMKAFFHNQRQAFRMIDCSDIARAYVKKGEDALAQYYKDTPIQVRNDFNHTSAGYCFDDLGVENNAKFFGTEVKVMESILEVRYRSKERLVTHIITNLNADEIKTAYGVRIADRMREMFNVVAYPVNAKSRRR